MNPLNRLRALVALLLLVGLFSGCLQQKETQKVPFVDVTPAQAKELMDKNPDLLIIDVSPNYDLGHLPGAVSYYLGDGSLDRVIPTLDENGEYLVYCHSDASSVKGAQKLVDAGFKHVYRLQGNYQAWVEAGYEVEPQA